MYKPKQPITPEGYSQKIKGVGDARREQDKLAYEAHKQAILSQSRSIDEDIALWGIGELKVQVVYQPPFASNYIWDIREKTENGLCQYELYESELKTRTVIAPGYKKVGFSSEELGNLVESIYATRVSLRIPPTVDHGLDGTLYGLNLYQHYLRVFKLAWWEESQPELRELDALLKHYVALFKEIPDKKDIA
jgi:hypothetical protein